MKNKAIIKTASYIGLICGISSIFFTSLYSPTPRASASISPNANPIAEITLNSNYQASEIRVDMDEEGNQYYVWRRGYTNDLLENCRGIYYQAYNKSGLPLTQPTVVEESCNVNFEYSTPDISVQGNQFAITYLEANLSTYSVKLAPFNRSSYTLEYAIQTVNSGLILDTNARPRISGTIDGSQTGIVFQACDDISCNSYNVYFQGFDDLYDKAHINNERINISTSGNQKNANISFSGNHFLVVFENQYFVETTLFRSIVARAVNYNASNLSPELSIDTDIVESPDVSGTIDIDYSATAPYLESFYVTYLKSPEVSPTDFDEILMKKVYCEYDPANPTAYYCNTTSRNGEPVFVRVNDPNDTSTKFSPQVSVFKNTHDLKRSYPYENTNINYLTVAWGQLAPGENFSWKARNYTNTLSASGGLINLADNVSNGETLSLASNQDGHFVATYMEGSGPNVKAAIYPTQFLRIDQEKLVNAPDSHAQENVKVAKNSNGDYVITYQSFNGTNYDIHYALYNKYGNPLKNTSIANSTLSGDQTNPEVAYWTEEDSSEHYGKFIISWSGNGSGDADGIFYQIFNQDGSPSGSETLVNQNTASLQDSPNLSTGKYGQIAIAYREETTGQATIVLFYKNNSNNIYTTISPSAADIRTPTVGLSPVADGTTGTGGNNKLFVTWRDDTSGYITHGYLSAATVITMNSTTNEGSFYTEDIDGAYNIANAGFTPALDPVYYARVGYYVGEVDSGPKLSIGFYGSAYQEVEPLTTQNTGNSVSVDPATQNIFVTGQKLAEYQPNNEQVLFFPANDPSSLNNEQIYDSAFLATATVSEGHGTYIFMKDATGPIYGSNNIGTATAYTSTATTSTPTILEFASDISTHFTVSQVVTDTVNGGSGTVVGIGPYHINLENVSGTLIAGGTLDNAPYNDSYINIPDSFTWANIYFALNQSLNFEATNNISDITLNDRGEILYVYPDLITVRMYSLGSFGLESLLDFNYVDTWVNDPIEYISGDFYRFTVNSATNTPNWIKAGPTFAVSEKSYYGQTFSSNDAAYHTGSADDAGKFIATAYSTSSSPEYIDANGIYQQLIEDPFSPGVKEDLSPTTEQQINPGGKYIIVPQTIDFGVVNRNESSTVDLANLTPSCIRITDLDGTDFDLTVSLTDLTHNTQPALTIANSNFIISNNNGVNPPITSIAPFSSATDVSLSPSTNPGENANLGTVQTLLNKYNSNTGSWKICPTAQLNIPANANSGTYSGTLTFTLI